VALVGERADEHAVGEHLVPELELGRHVVGRSADTDDQGRQ